MATPPPPHFIASIACKTLEFDRPKSEAGFNFFFLETSFFLMFFSLKEPMSHSRKLAHRTGHVTRVRKTPGFVPHGQPPPEHWQQEGNAGPPEEAGRPLKNPQWMKQPAETKRERNFMRRRL